MAVKMNIEKLPTVWLARKYARKVDYLLSYILIGSLVVFLIIAGVFIIKATYQEQIRVCRFCQGAHQNESFQLPQMQPLGNYFGQDIQIPVINGVKCKKPRKVGVLGKILEGLRSANLLTRYFGSVHAFAQSRPSTQPLPQSLLLR